MADLLWKQFTSSVDGLVVQTWPFAQTATLSFPVFDVASDFVVQQAGQRADTARYLIALLMSYPIGAVLGLTATHAQSPLLYHILNAATGIITAMWVFGPSWTVILAFAAIAYALLLIGTCSRAFQKSLPALMMVVCMTFMTVVHLHRLHVDYMGWSLDVSGPCMILTIKLTSLAYNIFDGAFESYYREEIEKSSKMSRFYSDFLSVSVRGVPNPLEFLGYVFCTPTLLAGPAVEYRQYYDAANNVNTPWGSRVWQGSLKFLVGLVFFGLTAVSGGYFPRGDPASGDVTLVPNTILAQPFFYKAAWTWALLLTFRFKYYGAWKLSEGAANMAGIGYKEHSSAGQAAASKAAAVTGKSASASNAVIADWDGASNMNVWGFETAPKVKDALRFWNMRTQNWLSRYVYLRVPRTASMNTLAVYTLSALWHGFYPGYYLTFLSAPLFSFVDDALSTRVKPRMAAMGSAAAVLYDLVGRVCASFALNYTVLPFQALGWKESVAAWSAFGYAGHAVAVALYILLMLIPEVKAKKAEGKTA